MRQYFWSALARSNVLKRHNSAVAKSNYLARIRDAWRETCITKRIVQRGAEIRVPRAAIGIGGISSVVCVKQVSIGLPPILPMIFRSGEPHASHTAVRGIPARTCP